MLPFPSPELISGKVEAIFLEQSEYPEETRTDSVRYEMAQLGVKTKKRWLNLFMFSSLSIQVKLKSNASVYHSHPFVFFSLFKVYINLTWNRNPPMFFKTEGTDESKPKVPTTSIKASKPYILKILSFFFQISTTSRSLFPNRWKRILKNGVSSICASESIYEIQNRENPFHSLC